MIYQMNKPIPKSRYIVNILLFSMAVHFIRISNCGIGICSILNPVIIYMKNLKHMNGHE